MLSSVRWWIPAAALFIIVLGAASLFNVRQFQQCAEIFFAGACASDVQSRDQLLAHTKSGKSYYELPTRVPNPKGLASVLITTNTDPRFHMFVYPEGVDKFISRNLVAKGVYELGTTRLMYRLLPYVDGAKSNGCEVNLVLDMGSNLGYYSLMAAARGYDVVSFEASPDTAWLQRSSAALNGYSLASSIKAAERRSSGSLVLLNKGVSDEAAVQRMTRHPQSPGMTSFVGNSSAAETTEKLQLLVGKHGSAFDSGIQLLRADDVLSDLGLSRGGQPHRDVCHRLLKIDVEGYELRALRGLGGLDRYPFEHIVMEYFPAMLFTDHESMIGDAMRIQRTPLSMPAACSLTRMMEPSHLLRVAAFTGSERDWRCTANPENTVSMSAEVTDLMLELKLLHMTREHVRLQVCRLHGNLPKLV